MPKAQFYTIFESGFTVAQLLAQLPEAMKVRLVQPQPLAGDATEIRLNNLASLSHADSRSIALVTERAYLAQAKECQAALFVVAESIESHARAELSKPILVSREAKWVWAALAAIIHPEASRTPTVPDSASIHASATIDSSATIGSGSRIDSGAVIGAAVVIGDHCHIAANCVIGDGVTIGRNAKIAANCVISHAVIGDDFTLYPNSSIGRPGFGFVSTPQSVTRLPQLGIVQIGNSVEIGANCTVDRGALEDTMIGDGCKIDNGVQVGHNCRFGRFVIITGHVAISGSVTLGDGVVLGAGVTISDHVTIGAGTQLAIGSVVTRDLAAGVKAGGSPAVPIRQWHRQVLTLEKLAKRE